MNATPGTDPTPLDDEQPYVVVRNDEEQYSVWPAGRDVPSGWTVVGEPGPKAACLAHIDEVWADLRPASLRRSMAAGSGAS